ncbi:MAG: glycoside hydrolase family 16 protein [Burkholderiaceae bacterium]
MRHLLVAAYCACAFTAAHAGVLFDDFSYADTSALEQHGWKIRSALGHPGIPGARWDAQPVQLTKDSSQPGNRLLRLRAQTDGRAIGTAQAQVCHQRKYFEGTYAARVHFTDLPKSGVDGDPVIQAFYLISPLRFDFDPTFSEVDWEYLANGGWASPKTRLYGITWQTVQIEPWQAFNQAHEEPGSHAGWQILSMQVAHGKTRHYLNGRLLAEHGGRNYPVVPMSLNFSLWFSPGGLLAPTAEPRAYEFEVDWVYHAQNQVLDHAQLIEAVQSMRKQGIARQDVVTAPTPPLESSCDL